VKATVVALKTKQAFVRLSFVGGDAADVVVAGGAGVVWILKVYLTRWTKA
jgi:hypothetical protein